MIKKEKIKYYLNLYPYSKNFPSYEDYVYEFYKVLTDLNIKENDEITIKIIYMLPNFKNKIKEQYNFLKKMEEDNFIKIINNGANHLKSKIIIKKMLN